jgi:hypothetical protein
VKEKDIFHVSGRTNYTDELSQLVFKVSLYHSWYAPKSRQRILQLRYTASYSALVKVR